MVFICVVKGFSDSFSGKLHRRGRKVKYLVQRGQENKGLVWGQKRIDSEQVSGESGGA